MTKLKRVLFAVACLFGMILTSVAIIKFHDLIAFTDIDRPYTYRGNEYDNEGQARGYSYNKRDHWQ